MVIGVNPGELGGVMTPDYGLGGRLGSEGIPRVVNGSSNIML